MTLIIENSNHSEATLEVAVSQVFLMSFNKSQTNWKISLGQNDLGSKTIISGNKEIILGRREYKTKSHVHSCRRSVSKLLIRVKPPESLLNSYHIIIYTVHSK